MELKNLLISKIEKEGPIRFEQFMETALYEPTLGYYCTGKERLGKKGDYFTSPGFTPLFGQLLAKQLEEMWMLMGKGDFTIVEIGGHKGRLCQDILVAMMENPDFFSCVRYIIVDQSVLVDDPPFNHPKVTWLSESRSLSAIHGCILSNELIDNFPFRIVEMKDDFCEVWVDFKNGNFKEVLRKDDGLICNYFDDLGIQLPAGYRTEVNLTACSWIREIARLLHNGYVITIDYGYSKEGLYNMRNRSGTLACYFRHTRNYDPYSNVGEQDITAHVNFSSLYQEGARAGLRLAGFTTQYYFLLGLGLTDYIRRKEQNKILFSETDHQNYKLIHTFLSEMGGNLKVLIQEKGMNGRPLSGCKFFNSTLGY